MLPTRASWCGTPAARAACCNPAPSFCPSCSSRAYGGCPFNSCNVASPAAIASGLPDSVPAWNTGPAGITLAMMSARPP